jgi:hypothetical protein
MCGGGGGGVVGKVARTVFPAAALGTDIAAGIGGALGIPGLPSPADRIPSAPAAAAVPEPPPKAAEAPRTPETPKKPAEVPSARDSAVNRDRRRRAAASGRGSRSTILTSPRGVTTSAPVAAKTLLGQ